MVGDDGETPGQRSIEEIRASTAEYQRRTEETKARTAAILARNEEILSERNARRKRILITLPIVLIVVGAIGWKMASNGGGDTQACDNAVAALKVSVLADRHDPTDFADHTIEHKSLVVCGPGTWKLAAQNINLAPYVNDSGYDASVTPSDALSTICTEADPQSKTETCSGQ